MSIEAWQVASTARARPWGRGTSDSNLLTEQRVAKIFEILAKRDGEWAEALDPTTGDDLTQAADLQALLDAIKRSGSE